MLAACNPFAPGLDDSADAASKLLSDQKTSDGIFQNLKYAYTLRDTSIYGQLIDGNFTFVYHDYDRGVDVTWGRDEEMRATRDYSRMHSDWIFYGIMLYHLQSIPPIQRQ